MGGFSIGLTRLAERYATPRARATIEVWRLDRQVARMDAKRRLRVEAEECFELRWSADGWKTVQATPATAVDSCGFYADALPGAGTGWSSRCTGRCAGNGRGGITP